MRATYTQLQQIIKPKLVGRVFQSDSIAGKISVTVKNIELSSSPTGVAIRLDFFANLPGYPSATSGVLHFMATPQIDVDNQYLKLQDIHFTRIIDSALWSLISRVFEAQIMAAIERNSELDYSHRLKSLEAKIRTQLETPSRVKGVIVNVKQLSIRLMEIIPESSTLAVRAKVITDLELDIPLSLMQGAINQ